jgi:crotonobetainyl-CoA:carnitine CoA-transferase CaiB-like acyl-CoA transferase
MTQARASGASPRPGPLAGVRVLDLSRILAGPTCTQLLGDLGADVIKVERPGAGDDTRTWGPPFVANANGEQSDLSAYFVCANRNKRSITVDMAAPSGVEVIRALAKVCDVVVENYKPGDLARRGLDYESLRGINPGLVWCSITGFGHSGPYSDRIGYDFLIQAMGGIMSITGDPDGEPQKVGVGVADVVCGLYATVGLLAALRHRDATGEGQFIDVALYDTQLAWLVNAATGHLASGLPPRRLGNRHPNIAPYQTCRAADGYLVVAVGNDGQYRRFVAALGCSELADDPRFATNADRVRNVDALDAALTAALARWPVAYWIDLLHEVDVPAGRVTDIPEALADPHTAARGMVVEMAKPGSGTLRMLGNPLNFDRTPVAYDRPPPSLGQDTDVILAQVLGLDRDNQERLRKSGAFGPSAARGDKP